jgi:phenylacetate-CoA ligase
VNYLDTLIVKIEVGQKTFHGKISELEGLKRRITDLLRTEILIHPKVVLVEHNSLPSSEGKAVRVIDRRGEK